MNCSNLGIMFIPESGAKLRICTAVGRVYGRNYYAPTHIQQVDYCTSDAHNSCSFYLKSVARGDALLSLVFDQEKPSRKTERRQS